MFFFSEAFSKCAMQIESSCAFFSCAQDCSSKPLPVKTYSICSMLSVIAVLIFHALESKRPLAECVFHALAADFQALL